MKTIEQYVEHRRKIIRLMVANGWIIKYDQKDIDHNRQDNPHYRYSFSKGIVHTWQIRNGWQVADLIDNHYCNHRPITCCTELLKDVS